MQGEQRGTTSDDLSKRVLLFQLSCVFGLVSLTRHVGCASSAPPVHTWAEAFQGLRRHLPGPAETVHQPAVGGERRARGRTRAARAEKVGKTGQPLVGDPPGLTSLHHLRSSVIMVSWMLVGRDLITLLPKERDEQPGAHRGIFCVKKDRAEDGGPGATHCLSPAHFSVLSSAKHPVISEDSFPPS